MNLTTDVTAQSSIKFVKTMKCWSLCDSFSLIDHRSQSQEIVWQGPRIKGVQKVSVPI